jgi:phosphoribosylaminoimidazole (AIR) synthetase
MGVGMIVIVREQNTVEAMEILKGAGEKPVVIGVVEKGKMPVKLIY